MSEIKQMTNEEYHLSKGISNSGLGLVLQSVSDYQWARRVPSTPSKELDIGTGAHALILEGEVEFYNQFDIMPKVDGRTKEGKAAIALFMATKGDKKIIDEDENKLIWDMKKSIDVYYARYATKLEAKAVARSIRAGRRKISALYAPNGLHAHIGSAPDGQWAVYVRIKSYTK